MPQENDVMKFEKTLPRDFDGVFRFTNWTDEDFVGVWGKKHYHYPAGKTSPMIIPDQSPIEIQHIRKKFARDLATREYFKGTPYSAGKAGNYAKLIKQEVNSDGTPRLNSIQQAGSYTDSDLAPYIKRCLEPLPISKAIVEDGDSFAVVENLSRDDNGDLNSIAFGLKDKVSLRDKAFKNEKLVVEM